jgi:tetratricopeptide (TPR) repeat protein
MRKRPPSVALLALALWSCHTGGPGPGQAGAGALPGAVQAGKELLDKGQLDEALAKLAAAPDDPVALYYQGIVYTRKAAGQALPEQGFRDEDKQAIRCFERAVAAKPEFAAAHFSLAETLSPYTLKRHGPQPGGKNRAKPPSPEPDDPDISPERVAREYQAAVQNDKTSNAPLEALVRYAREMKRPEDAEVVYKEAINRNKESEDAYIRYGDFLAAEKKDRLKAIEQYQLALMWKPQDPVPTAKICDIYLDWAQEHYDHGENASADARLADAGKFVTPQTPQAQRMGELREKLRERRR